ncbi:MAG: hypothetical protein ACKV2Q_02380 [Planctomycetaceae bacterium]
MRSTFCLVVVGWLLASPCRADIKVVVAQRELPVKFDVAKATPDEEKEVGDFSISKLDPKLAERLTEFNPRELAEKADVDLVVTFSTTSADASKGASGVSVWDRRGLLIAEEDLAAEPLETSMRQAVRVAGLKVTRDRAKLISLRVICVEGSQLEFVQLALERAFVQSPLIAVDFQRATQIQPPPEVQKTIRLSAGEKRDGPPNVEIVILDAKQNSIATFVLPRETLTSGRLLKLADEVAEKVGAAAFMTPEKQKTAARRLRAAGQDAFVKRSLQASFTPLMASILLNDRDLEAVRFLLHSMAQTVNDDLFRARDTELHQMAESLFDIRKFAAQQLPPDYERLVAFDGKTTPDQFSHFRSHLKSIVDFGKEHWPPELMQRMEQTYVDGVYELFSKWKTIAANDPQKFSEFSEYTASNLWALMHYANGGTRPSLCDEMSARITADWLNEFEKLPAAEQNWQLPKRGLLHATTEMPTVCGKTFQPLWTRMEKSKHQFVQVLGLRGPLMIGWDEEVTHKEKGKRLATYYARTLPILDAELKAGRRNNVHELIENYSLIANNTSQLANACEPIMTAHMNLADELLKRNVIHHVALVSMTRCHDESSALRAIELIRKFPRFEQHQNLRDHLQAIEKRFPGVPRLLKDAEPPLMEVVLDVRDLGDGDHISHITVRDGVAYGLHLHPPGGNALARVLQVDLKSKTVKTVSDLPALDLVVRPFNGLPHKHVCGCLGTNSYFVSSPSSGVLRVPLAGDPPTTVISSEQLKDLPALSMTQAGDRLFVGTDDGRLLSADLKSGVVNTLVNGQREIAVTPVDPLGQHRIPALVSDEKDEQLWFITETGSFQTRDLILWHYQIAKNEFKRLANLGRPQSQVAAHRSGSELVVSDCWLLRWDMKTNEKISLTANYPCGDLQPDTQQWLGPVGPSVELGNSLWWITGNTLNQLPKSQKNYRRYELPQRMPRPNANQPASLIRVNNEEFLIDVNQQWLRVQPNETDKRKAK